MEQVLEGLLSALPGPAAPGFAARWQAVGDREGVLRAAERHALRPLLLDALLAADLLPTAQAAEARRELAVARLRARRHEALLDGALSALAAAGLAAVALKGPLLARRLYGDPALRPSTDLDLLVAPRDLAPAVAALSAAGWREPGGAVQRHLRRNFAHLHLHGPAGVTLELHFRLDTGLGVDLPVDDLLARSVVATTAGGAPARLLAPEDELLFLALHLVRHAFGRLVWGFDLKLLALRQPCDGSRVASLARELGVERGLSLALTHVRERLAAPFPEPATLGLPVLGPRRRGLIEALLRRSDHAPSLLVQRAAQLTAPLLLARGVTARGRLVAHLLRTPLEPRRARRQASWTGL